MDKDRFYTYLKEGIEGTSEEQDDLLSILQQYPYFQSARVMLSKSAYLSGHHEFDQMLQQAAIHVGDRSFLFQEHTKELLSKTMAKVEAELENMPLAPEETSGDVEVEVVEEPATREATQQGDTEEDLHQETELTKEVSSSSEQKEPIPHQPEKENPRNTKDDKKRFDEMNELDQEVLLGAMSSSIVQELREHQESTDENASTDSTELNQETLTASTPHQASPETAAEKEEEGLSMFASWVYSRARGMQYGEGLQEVSAVSGEIEPEEKHEREASEEATKAELVQPTSKEDIIDAFIKNEPKITPRRAMDVDPPEVVAKALVQDEEWVTETLAQVYAKQGNLGKARKAYKLLALKYPEKSVYFANQIKKLGNQSNK